MVVHSQNRHCAHTCIHAYVKLLRSKQTRVRIEQSEKVKEPWQESEDPHEPIASEDRPLKKGERWTAVHVHM